MHLAS